MVCLLDVQLVRKPTDRIRFDTFRTTDSRQNQSAWIQTHTRAYVHAHTELTFTVNERAIKDDRSG